MQTRNFAVIAHIDHGKSTLADRLIERAGKVTSRNMHAQLLDSMDLERERGITIKLAPMHLEYEGYSLNLIDTPGHVDFQYEVSRSLAACEGAVLLVDATSGVQAQTLSVLEAAKALGLTIIGAVNKIDAPGAEIEATITEIANLLDCDPQAVLKLSARTGEGVDELLHEIIKQIPPATDRSDLPSKLLVFDSIYDSFRGVVAYVRVVEGKVKTGDTLLGLAGHNTTDIAEVGIFLPGRAKIDELTAGDIGYLVTQFKDVRSLRVGETLATDSTASALPGYKEVTPMVYASFFPLDRTDTSHLREAIEKYALNDAAFSYTASNHAALGSGFRCGFLGVLHLDIVRERLTREYELELIVTPPTVEYRALLTNGELIQIATAGEFPDPSKIAETEEPIAQVEVISPSRYLGSIYELAQRHRGSHTNTEYLDHDRTISTFTMPLAEIILTFNDELKSVTSGFGSLNYKVTGWHHEQLVKLDILLSGEEIAPLTQIVPASKAEKVGRDLCSKLKDLLPQQNFAVAVQASISGKVIARETVPALRKDVTAKLYGGDVTRKRKLLEKQKKGKKRLAQFGKVSIPPEIFIDVLKKQN